MPNEPRKTLIHHVVSECINEGQTYHADFVAAFKGFIHKAERLNFDESINNPVSAMMKDLEKLENSIKKDLVIQDLVSGELNTHKTLLKKWSSEAAKLQSDYKLIEEKWCIDKRKMKLQDLIKILSDFTRTLDKACGETVKLEEAKKKKFERLTKQGYKIDKSTGSILEAPPKLKKTNFKHPPKNEAIMDNLLSEIKFGGKLKKVETVEKRASNLFLNVPVVAPLIGGSVVPRKISQVRRNKNRGSRVGRTSSFRSVASFAVSPRGTIREAQDLSGVEESESATKCSKE